MASTSPQTAPVQDELGMAERIRAFDWASTPLGPMESWPEALRFALRLCERASAATAVYWGPELILLYNDAWAPVMGDRHPGVLGQPAPKVWPRIWPVLEPQFAQVMATGKGLSLTEQMVPVLRDGVEEESYWTYSFTPITGEDGAVLGILGQRHEVTRTVMAERRLSFQMDLADRLRGADDPERLKMIATELLGRYLGAARVGYGEVDDGEKTVSVMRDWTRDESVLSLAGQSGLLEAFGADALRFLRTGETIAIADYRAFPQAADAEHAPIWESIAVRALIVVPLVREGRLRALLYVHEPEPRPWKRAEAAMARDVAERTWAAVERARAEQSLRESEDHYRHAVELNPQVSWTALPDGQLNRVSKRWFEWTGTPGTGESWAEGLHPDDRARTFEVWRHSVATGEVYDIEHRVQYRDGRYRWARSRAFSRRDGAGQICLWYGTTEDIHERKLAEDRQRLLINELNHRVKNTLATVQAIAFQSLRGDLTLDEARSSFEARLQALSRAHNLLTEQHWEGASIERVIGDSTGYFAADSGRITLSGEPLWLGPRAALALALAFHELATNAGKYGALSVEGGSVSIAWAIADDRLSIAWKERGGPAVAMPERRGFGSRLIERGLASDLGGTAEIRFEPDGLACRIEAALEAVRPQEAPFA